MRTHSFILGLGHSLAFQYTCSWSDHGLNTGEEHRLESWVEPGYQIGECLGVLHVTHGLSTTLPLDAGFVESMFVFLLEIHLDRGRIPYKVHVAQHLINDLKVQVAGTFGKIGGVRWMKTKDFIHAATVPSSR
jgi:hypothetical protein